MDISKPITLTFTAASTREDGSPLAGTVSYIVRFSQNGRVVAQVPSRTTSLTTNAAAIPLSVGIYMVDVVTVVTFNGVESISTPSEPVQLVLEVLSLPKPPTGLRFSTVGS